MARNIELVMKSFRMDEEVATELTKLIFGERSSNAAALSKFSHFDKEILETLRESIDPEWKVETKEDDKKPLENDVNNKKEDDVSPIPIENKKELCNIIPFRFEKNNDKEVKRAIDDVATVIDEEIAKLKDIPGDDPKFDEAVENLSKMFKNLKEEDKKPLEETESKEEFKPVTPDEVVNVIANIITKSIKNIPAETAEYLNGVFEGIKKLDFSKIKSNSMFDKKINTTLSKLADPIAESLDAAGYVVNKDVLKEQFYKTADGVIDPIVLTKKFVYNTHASLNRIVSAFDMNADIAKEFRKDLKSCISGMNFQNVDEFVKEVVDNHEQVFATVYNKYVLQENLKYAYENSKDNPFELAIELKESYESPEDSFVVGEEVSPEELSAQINEVLDSGSGEVVVTKRKWQRKSAAKK